MAKPFTPARLTFAIALAFPLHALAETAARPALVIATPPGFIGAEEAKEALIANDLGLPYLALRGRRGGSALAAAALNALVIEEDMA